VIVQAVRLHYTGQVLSVDLMALLLDRLALRGPALSPRDLDVVRGLLEGLSAENRAALDQALVTLKDDSFQFDGDAASEATARADLTDEGVTWYADFSEADVAAIREAAAATWLKLSEEGGEAAVAYRAKILDLIGQ
jgi:hypothetical protein